MFFLLYRHADDGLFKHFPKIFDRFPKIYEGHTNVAENFPKIFEDCQRLPKAFEEDPKMFRPYTNEFTYNLRNKLDISEITDIFTSEDMENMPRESRILFRMNFTSGVFSSKTLVSV